MQKKISQNNTEKQILNKMKRIIVLLNVLFISIVVTGQSKIILKYLHGITERTLQWTINGVTFNTTIDEVTIYPHEKGMDTIYFQETRNQTTKFDTIYTKIPNNQELIMTIGCCDEKFDIIRKEDFEKRRQLFLTEPSLDFDSLDITLLEFGKLKFVILNKPISDTLICSYARIFAIGQMITVDKDYGWVEPCRIGYIDNIIHVDIMKLNKHINYDIIEDDDFECAKGIDIVERHLMGKENDLEILKQFGLRLFNNERVIIQYDYLTGELQLIIDE